MKVSIHVNSQHLSQMVSQISRTYDFDRKFMEKRCGLSASLYGIDSTAYFPAMLVGSVKNASLLQKFTLNLIGFRACDLSELI